MEDKDIKELLAEISGELKKIRCLMEAEASPDINDPQNWWTPEKSMKYMGVSVRTLYNIRQTEVDVIWKRVRGQIRYFGPSLLGYRNQYLK